MAWPPLLLALLLPERAWAGAPSVELGDRVAGALWGLFVGDALAMPVHWYYGGPDQVRRDFGGQLIRGYEKAVHPFPESIMQLSNTGGAGRGGDEGELVGSVILHGKKEYWKRGGQYHYHVTLEAGENTLEASLARLLMRNIAENHGSFSPEVFRQEYIHFMTTPGTHNDTYASTCHRMFFKNWKEGRAPEDCPDNDGHNVDTMDGLVLPAVALLAGLGAGRSAPEALGSALGALGVARSSPELPAYVEVLADLLAGALAGRPLAEVAQEVAQQRYGGDLDQEVRRRGDRDPMVACYIGGAFPALLHFAYKYAANPVEEGLLASANAGGENVHRGAVLGALLGAAAGVESVPKHLRSGLFAYEALEKEISRFVVEVGLERRRRTGQVNEL